MGNIALLIKKDFYTTKVLLGMGWILYLAVWIAFSLFIGSMIAFYGIIVVFVLVIALFGAEDNQQMSDINNILPVSRSNIVVARYMFAWIVSFGVSGIAAILTIARGVYANHFVNVAPIFIQLATSALFIINFTLPVIYRFGIQKARLYCTIMYMSVIMSSNWLQLHLVPSATSITTNAHLIMPAFLIAMLLFAPVSMYLSRRWYNNR